MTSYSSSYNLTTADIGELAVAPLPIICVSVSLATFYGHISLIFYVRDLRYLYGRYLLTAFTLYVSGNTIKLVSCLMDMAPVPKIILAPFNAVVHLLELVTAAWCFASVLLLWQEERRNNARQSAPLVRIQSCAKYFKCLGACLLFAFVFVFLGLASSSRASRDAATRSILSSRSNNITMLTSSSNSAISWHGFLESASHALDVFYFRSSLMLVYRDRDCAAPHPGLIMTLRPVAASYAYVLAMPSLLLYLLQAPMLISLGQIFDAMHEERRQDSRVEMNAFRVLAKLAVSSVMVHAFSLMSLLLYHSCEAVCLWHIHFMLQALQSIFLCLTCLCSRPSIEILMERFGTKEDTKLESGLGLLAAVMHSKRAKNMKAMQGAGGPYRPRAKYPFLATTT